MQSSKATINPCRELQGNQNGKLESKKLLSNDRNSPGKATSQAREGVLSSLSLGNPKVPSSGRLNSSHQVVRSTAAPQQGSTSSGYGQATIEKDRPSRNSAPSDLKSHSFSSGLGVYQALRGLTPSSAFVADRKSADIVRRSTPSSLLKTPSQLQHSASLPIPASRARPPPLMPVENSVMLEDVMCTYGHSTFQGQRDYQEDALAVLLTPTSLQGGVYDGHGGDEVSKELEKTLLQNIHQKVAEAQARNPDDVRGIEAAIRSAYVNTNEEIGQKLDRAQDAGSCAVTILFKKVGGRTYLFCANAGDCRAVLCTQSGSMRRAVRLSEDHKPHPNVCPSEITRICDAGGCVLWGRVQGCLAVSRAFGDRTLQPFVIADPHVLSRPIDLDRDQFVYLASDGVTDMIDDHQGCNIVADQLNKGVHPTQAAQALVSAAFHRGSCDNISVMVLKLQRRGPY